MPSFLDDKILEGHEIGEIANNDGLSSYEFASWFRLPGWQDKSKKTPEFSGQIICWHPDIDY